MQATLAEVGLDRCKVAKAIRIAILFPNILGSFWHGEIELSGKALDVWALSTAIMFIMSLPAIVCVCLCVHMCVP